MKITFVMHLLRGMFAEATTDVASVARAWHKRYDISSPQYRQFTDTKYYHIHIADSHTLTHSYRLSHQHTSMFTFLLFTHRFICEIQLPLCGAKKIQNAKDDDSEYERYSDRIYKKNNNVELD